MRMRRRGRQPMLAARLYVVRYWLLRSPPLAPTKRFENVDRFSGVAIFLSTITSVPTELLRSIFFQEVARSLMSDWRFLTFWELHCCQCSRQKRSGPRARMICSANFILKVRYLGSTNEILMLVLFMALSSVMTSHQGVHINTTHKLSKPTIAMMTVIRRNYGVMHDSKGRSTSVEYVRGR